MINDIRTEDAPTPELTALAEEYGVATEYWSFFGDRVHVPAATLRAILSAMGVDAQTDRDDAAALADARDRPWRLLVPPSVVVREGSGALQVHVTDGHDVSLKVDLEDASVRDIPIPPQDAEPRTVDGGTVWRLHVPLPDDLPLGWHIVHAAQRPHGASEPDRTAECVLVVTPDTLAPPPSRPDRDGRAWGLMAQLYSVRSRGSWGVGDFADLGDLASIAGARGADFLLVNPVHAAEVTSPIEPSPYLPATRRFLAPLYVRPEDVREAAYLTASDRSQLDAVRGPVAAADADAERIDRDASWAAKRAALQLVYAVPRSPARQALLDAYVAREGQPLLDFALWCALEEHFDATLGAGEERPADASDIASPFVEQLRGVLTARIGFHVWLQWIVDEQLAAAHSAAKASGMRIGIMHDLAVGVHTRGSDAWSMREMYAPAITVGAPPDMYNQQGQNWNQPPWLPHALAESGYAPLRDMIRTLLRNAGALRIDHVIGFFRLWWIPAGLGEAAGTYVRYDHEAMIGVLTLEAHRAGAVVIGEDLGNVEPWVRDYLSSRGVLGTSILWFEYENDGFKPPEHYRRAVLATVNTHDLPPTAGYLAGEHIDLRARLGLLTEPVEQARAEAVAERDAMLAILREHGLVSADATEQQIVEALHLHLATSPSQLLGVALVDAVGERRVQNQPGTENEYPNWRVPLADSVGTAVLLDDLAENERFRSLTDRVDAALHR
jgi:4-alpha-glucanotransferase